MDNQGIRSCSCRSGPLARLPTSLHTPSVMASNPQSVPGSPNPFVYLDRKEEHTRRTTCTHQRTLHSTMSSPPSNQPTQFLLQMLLLPFDVIPRSKQANRLPQTAHITSACVADQWTSLHVTLPLGGGVTHQLAYVHTKTTRLALA